MRTLTEWSRVNTSDQPADGGVTSQNKGEPSDVASDLVNNLMENIFTSAQLVQLAEGRRVFSERLHRWQDELQSTLAEFDEGFTNQTRDFLMAVVFPWLSGKVTSKAIDDICSEFGALAKEHKKSEILLTAPAELRPVLEKRLGITSVIPSDASSEIVIQLGAIKIQTDIESWLKKLGDLLVT